MVAAKVRSGTITSSPGPMPSATSARCRATVPLETAMPCRAPDEAGEAFLELLDIGALARDPRRQERVEHRAELAMAHVGPCDLQALRRAIDSDADQVAGGIEIGLQDVGGRRVRAMAAKLAQVLAERRRQQCAGQARRGRARRARCGRDSGDRRPPGRRRRRCRGTSRSPLAGCRQHRRRSLPPPSTPDRPQPRAPPAPTKTSCPPSGKSLCDTGR